jgi:Protein tyrosine and serine/threonine kinase
MHASTLNMLRPAVQVDVYSYGIVLWELWTGREPFEGLNYHALLHQMTSAGEAMRPPLPGSADWDAAQVRQRCAADSMTSGACCSRRTSALAQCKGRVSARPLGCSCCCAGGWVDALAPCAGAGGCGAGARVPRAAGALLERAAIEAPSLRRDCEGAAGGWASCTLM